VVGLCVWLLLIETLLAGEVPSAAKFTPGASAGALQSAGSLKLVTPAVGALLLAAYTSLAAAAGALSTQQHDLG
jgi:ABC-2 type transport system permease protein